MGYVITARIVTDIRKETVTAHIVDLNAFFHADEEQHMYVYDENSAVSTAPKKDLNIISIEVDA